jgi:pimeloyl-ACP methyl ester carboxylesterase
MALGDLFGPFARADRPATTAGLEQLIGGERLAFLREVALMPRGLAAVIPVARPGDDVVVLVHGFLASAGVFRPLRARLEREIGARVATFTHAPGVGIRRIARQLADTVDAIPRGARVTVVGHSIGGLAARWYVQELSGHRRVARTISLATPFGGVDVPQLLVGVDLHEQSDLLRRIRDRAHGSGVPHTSVVAADDTVVVGVQTACLGVGDVVIVRRRGHNAILFDDAVSTLILERLRGGPTALDKGPDSFDEAW